MPYIRSRIAELGNALGIAILNEDDAVVKSIDEELTFLEAFEGILRNQHAQWIERNRQDCAYEKLENRLCGYGR